MNIVEQLASVVKEDAHALELLRAHGVTSETYAAFVYDDELRRSRRVGLAVSFVLIVGLFLLTFFASAEAVSDPKSQWWFGLGGGLLGLLIAWGTMRKMAGKRWKYVDEPEETASGFHLLGMVNRLDAKHVQKLDDMAWSRLKAFKLDLKAKRYEHLPTEPKSAGEKAKLMRMTPRKERLVARLERVKRICAWLILGAVFAVFTPGLFFVFWAWFFAGLWLALESVVGIVKRQMGAFSETTVVDVYGWPARAYAWFMLFLALVIFVIPGLLGMFASLGTDLVDLIFS